MAPSPATTKLSEPSAATTAMRTSGSHEIDIELIGVVGAFPQTKTPRAIGIGYRRADGLVYSIFELL